MNWLTAALAFAITMLLLTSMVSAIVESVQRVFGLRRRGLQWMLRAMYEEVGRLRPDLVSQLGRAAQALTVPVQASGVIQKAAAWLRGLGAAPLAPATARFLETMSSNAQADQFRGWLPHFLRPQHVQSLTPVEFAQRLARTDLGAMLAKKAEAEWQTLLNGVLERFDFYGQAAGETFRQRAKVISLAVSFVSAFVLNVNAVALFSAFANRPQLSEAVVLLQDQAQQSYVDAQKRRADAQAGGAENPASAEQVQKEVQATLNQVKTQFASLVTAGLPIGWSAANCPAEPIDEFCRTLRDLPKWTCADQCGWLQQLSAAGTFARACIAFPFGHLHWFFSTLLGGLLIGLGGPFWYNVCTSLSRAAQLARAVSDGVKGSANDARGTPSPGTEPLLSTPARAFAAANILTTQVPALGRVLLNARGEPEFGPLPDGSLEVSKQSRRVGGTA